MTKDERDEIRKAITITIPGGVLLTSEEEILRRSYVPSKPENGRTLIVARSILTKVRNACAGAV